MSEDVDLKVVVADGHGMTRTALKNHLSSLKQKVADALNALGFQEDVAKRVARNENRYIASEWAYLPRYAHDASLRPYLRLELTVRTPQQGTTRKPLGYLVDHLAGRALTRVELDCVTVEETLSEKVVSFLRRYA